MVGEKSLMDWRRVFVSSLRPSLFHSVSLKTTSSKDIHLTQASQSNDCFLLSSFVSSGLATATTPGTGLATDISSESESLDRDGDIIFLENQPRESEKEINETRHRRIIHSFMSLNHKKGTMGFNGAAGCLLGQLLLRHCQIVPRGYTN
jgi:hypothetical protein